ncbi:type VI secretion system protein TssA [Desulfonatronum sp. SC1]|uniref:type VI secretion system protein TssA n=1 Tax=Desulfonatronum sp. SC1 TaxID=2109626 RepID=UPI000D317643|nr:type VI secretion system protein TssA [Desulfonatronum sp. SC1]PTN35984.1 type VI secretion system protein TssA [Desulfonatronum sp. SC1]
MDLNALGREPIPGASPVGQDARYDLEYDQLQGEIDKLNSVTNLTEVSWKRVVELGTNILETKSKDLLAAVYLSVGLLHEAGLEGMGTGSQVLRDMVASFWDDCFPPKKRLRGRINAFSWWQEKTTAWLKGLPPDPVPAELHRTILENVEALDKSLGELLPDLPPLRDVIVAVKRLPVQSPPQEEQRGKSGEDPADQTQGQDQGQAQAQNRTQAQDNGEDKVSEPSPSRSEAQAPSSAKSASPVLSAVPPEDVASARKALGAAATAFVGLGRGADPTDSWVWKAARIAAWLAVKTLPPNQGGQTMIPAPDVDIKAALRKLIAEGKFREAAFAAESRFPGAIFWFDLQQVTAKALEGLGEDYAPALAVVRGELWDLLTRFQGLEQLAFVDGTPFADPETKAWITTLAGGARGTGTQGGAAEDDEFVHRALEQAESRYTKKDEPGALDALSTALRAAPNGPAKIQLRLAQMDMLSRSGRFALAVTLAEELLTEMENRDLATWAPELTVDVLRACHGAYLGKGGEANLARARELAGMVGRIRPAAALNLAI